MKDNVEVETFLVPEIFVKYLKLKNGSELISGVEFFEDHIKLHDPMELVYISNQTTGGSSVLFKPWLPDNVTKDNSAELSYDDMLITPVEVSDEIYPYYESKVASWHQNHMINDSLSFSYKYGKEYDQITITKKDHKIDPDVSKAIFDSIPNTNPGMTIH